MKRFFTLLSFLALAVINSFAQKNATSHGITGGSSRVWASSSSPCGGIVSGDSIVCVGSSTLLTDSAAGGVWSSASPSAATIDSVTGMVTGLANGIAYIQYAVSDTSCSAVVIYTLTVGTPVGAISGPSAICDGVSRFFTVPAVGGTWSISNTNAAFTASDSTAEVTGLLAGNDTLTYTLTNSCGTAADTQTFVINPSPPPVVISGPSAVCVGVTITFTATVTGGSWSTSSGAAGVVPLGSLNCTIVGLAAGASDIQYIITNSYGCSSVAGDSVTVHESPYAGVVSGSLEMCVGATDTFTDVTPGGTWYVSGAYAVITDSGVVTATSAGIEFVGYTVTSAFCGSASAGYDVRVDTTPHASLLLGSDTAYVNLYFFLHPLTVGDISSIWSTSDSAIATVIYGNMYTYSPGIDTITYTITNGCGSSDTSFALTVLADTTTGVSNVATGYTNLSVMPNPAHQNFTVTVSAPVNEDVNITIINIAGEKIKEFPGRTNESASISLDIPAGIYLISASTKGGNYTNKLVIQ